MAYWPSGVSSRVSIDETFCSGLQLGGYLVFEFLFGQVKLTLRSMVNWWRRRKGGRSSPWWALSEPCLSRYPGKGPKVKIEGLQFHQVWKIRYFKKPYFVNYTFTRNYFCKRYMLVKLVEIKQLFLQSFA